MSWVLKLRLLKPHSIFNLNNTTTDLSVKYYARYNINNKYSTYRTNRSIFCKFNDSIIGASMYVNNVNKRLFFVSRFLEKGKEKGDKKKKVEKAQHIDLLEARQVMDVDKYTSQLDYALEELKNSYIKHLTLRSSVGAIEQVTVHFEGEDYMLQDLTQIVHKPKTVVVNVTSFPQAIPQILEALSKSGLNLNPQQDGTTLFIPIPKVTKEYREGMAKNAKALFVKCRDNIKDVRNREFKNLKKAPSINEDQMRRVQSQLEALCDKYIKQAEGILDTKQKELLKTSD
ncbi:GSCOCG00003903001-RA-CDS [Cotesia congregata]|uniref:Ribosome-recycling factor, mitochondrial n=1 Tax=Cotesia congregata TaxID=51543 RepID=A0A8J2MN22_COTCN|nr:GSCOCG00003903001-RA-CDS [Cotesia congregata]CAG5099953.1 Similar to MRRF: Ribosome-recycling factor [Cotesia congregata]